LAWLIVVAVTLLRGSKAGAARHVQPAESGEVPGLRV
jgi:hypothetical protein